MDNQLRARYLTPEMKIVFFNNVDMVRTSTSFREGTVEDFNGTYGDMDNWE